MRMYGRASTATMTFELWAVSSRARLRRWLADNRAGHSRVSCERLSAALSQSGFDRYPGVHSQRLARWSFNIGTLPRLTGRKSQLQNVARPVARSGRGGRSSERRTGSRCVLSAGQSCLREKGMRTMRIDGRQPKNSSGEGGAFGGLIGRSGLCEHLPPAQGAGIGSGRGWTGSSPRSKRLLSRSWSLRLNSRWARSPFWAQGWVHPACAFEPDRTTQVVTSTNVTILDSTDRHRGKEIIGLQRLAYVGRCERHPFQQNAARYPILRKDNTMIKGNETTRGSQVQSRKKKTKQSVFQLGVPEQWQYLAAVCFSRPSE
jgi:hypothetical protein